MDLFREGSSLDGAKGSKGNVDEKRELVYELSKCPGASDVLQSWSRQEILQVLCAEMGKERKYTGLTKFKMIEQLLKIVTDKMGQSHTAGDIEIDETSENAQISVKRQKKTETLSRLPLQANCSTSNNVAPDASSAVYCKNSACKAVLRQDDLFCKRCSCCLCHRYDDNKDPSLWLNCCSEPPFQGLSCGMSCHLECALKHETSVTGKNPLHARIEGGFQCPFCGKVNDLLGCWKKQLLAAKDTRRVDILCYRLSLCHKLLIGSVKYQQLHKIIDEAVKVLESEVGPLSGVPVKMGRGIVNRLSSGPEVQKRCALALSSFEKLLLNTIIHQPKLPSEDAHAQTKVRFEDVSSTSLAVVVSYEGPSSAPVGYNLWYRKTCDGDYGKDPTSTLYAPNSKFVVDSLSPKTEYLFKVVSFNDMMQLGTCEVQCITSGDPVDASKFPERSQSPTTNCSGLSVEDESNDRPLKQAEAAVNNELAMEITCSEDVNKMAKSVQEWETAEEATKTNREESLIDANLPITPCKIEAFKDVQGRAGRSKASNKSESHGGDDPQDGSTSKKRGGEKGDEECTANNTSVRDLEYYVKVIRWLECEGHLEKNFRQKFLTWYSLRASAEEIRVVKAFVDALLEDPASLAEQLVDSFADCLSTRDHSVVPAGFCMKLWH